jgi:hypothetical protein
VSKKIKKGAGLRAQGAGKINLIEKKIDKIRYLIYLKIAVE